MPTIVCATPSSVSARPITFGSLPSRAFQKRSVITATSAPSSSSGKNVRPRVGAQAKHLEVIRRRLEDRYLERITQPGHSGGQPVFAGEPIEDLLPVAEMVEARRRNREIDRLFLEM